MDKETKILTWCVSKLIYSKLDEICLISGKTCDQKAESQAAKMKNGVTSPRLFVLKGVTVYFVMRKIESIDRKAIPHVKRNRLTMMIL